MWENIVASSLVCGTLLVIFGIISAIIKQKQLNKSKQYFKQLDEQTKVGINVILINGIVGEIKSINDNFIEVQISPNVTVTCIRYSIKQVINN